MAAESPAFEADLRPRLAVLLGGAVPLALVSVASLEWPAAIASIVLGLLMIAGAEIDARTFLLPNAITLGALGCGVIAATALDSFDPLLAGGAAAARAGGTAIGLLIVRWCYARMRGREGLGLGDVKLAAAIGAWLPLEAIPVCFALASIGALILVLLAQVAGQDVRATTKLAFGAFLCPALWLVFYASVLMR
jgi:leader peptidase (prepilin peptidase)/N-methyltransferase